MSLNIGPGVDSASPTNSGRSTPMTRSSRRTADDEQLLRHDKGYRRYAAIIERALASWEIAPEEWADYIAFLGRLLKAIQSHSKDSSSLPHSSKIATRLAQCLNPALPSGVHQKALEVYHHIFEAFGVHYVSGHLHEFLPGLSAVLSFASLSVRPGLYSLLEEYAIELPAQDLRPALKSLILGILPALEEESSEDFDRAFKVLQRLEVSFHSGAEDVDAAHDGYFWQCIFLAVITSSSRRQGALNYLSRKLPKLTANASISPANSSAELSRAAECVVSPEPGLLVRCFVCGLSDEQVLIQRGFLDLLVTHLPLCSIILQERISNDDLDRLVTAAIQILLRKEMSLNRRLWSWFLGPEAKDQSSHEQASSPTEHLKEPEDPESGMSLRYFSTYGRASLQRCILRLMRVDSSKAAEKARPFRISLSLMDRWEIGSLIMPHIFTPLLDNLYEYSLATPPENVAEVIRSASLFFDGVEASLIWRKIMSLVQYDANSDDTPKEKDLQLAKWIITTFNVQDEEMLMVHAPHALAYVLTGLGSRTLPESKQSSIAEFALQLVHMIPVAAFSSNMEQASALDQGPTEALVDDQVRSLVEGFYLNIGHRSKVKPPPISPVALAKIAYSKATVYLTESLVTRNVEQYTQAATLLRAVTSRVHNVAEIESTVLLNRVLEGLSSATDFSIPFPIISSTVSLIASMRPAQGQSSARASDLLKMADFLATCIWDYMSPTRTKHHVEAVRTLWQLEDLIAPDHTLVVSLLSLMRSQASQSTLQMKSDSEVVRRFATLWNHTISHPNTKTGNTRRRSSAPSMTEYQQARRQGFLQQPLMLVLDTLIDPTHAAFVSTRSWMNGLASLDVVFRYLFQEVKTTLQSARSTEPSIPRRQDRVSSDRARELNYLLGHFYNLLLHGSTWTWSCFSTTTVTSPITCEEEHGLHALARLCVRLLSYSETSNDSLMRRVIGVLNLALTNPLSVELRSLELDNELLEWLPTCISGKMTSLQGDLLHLISLALKLRLVKTPSSQPPEQRSRKSISAKAPPVVDTRSHTNLSSSLWLAPPPQLFKCLQLGFSSKTTRFHLDQWITFLADILPMFADAIFTNLIPLVECLCGGLNKAHTQLVNLSKQVSPDDHVSPDIVILSLLDALELVLDRAYENLVTESVPETTPRAAESNASFLANVTSGVFRLDGQASKTTKANNRLTVILALQDTIKVTLSMWLWANGTADAAGIDTSSSATTAYSALKVRNKTRHLLEQIFTVEPLESLEVVMSQWCNTEQADTGTAILSLLHAMQVSRPKTVIPSTIDAINSRTNPSSLPSARVSSQTIELSAAETALFLSAYLRSTEDDATDEVWLDCTSFLREVLANPLPYRQILPHTLSITLLLAEKLSNTNYGEQRKMRRDLGDIFQRLLTATFTALPSGYIAEPAVQASEADGIILRRTTLERSMTLVSVLDRAIASVDLILDTPERVTAMVNNISTNFVSPTIRAKSFPKNVSNDFLTLVLQMAQKAQTVKSWKKDVADAFNDPKFLASSQDMIVQGWFPILRQWSLHDKERMPELLARLSPPSSAGIMFGVGASTARLEADRRTQLNLRRICILLLASPQDTYVAHFRVIEEKIAELFEASVSSSPSITIKAELFMLCRALTLSVSSIHLSPLWPIINEKLQLALTSLLPNSTNANDFNNLSLLEACKLLDLLIAFSPEEFQLHEWLYVTDTIDAVYQPDDWTPMALADHITGALDASSTEETLAPPVSNAKMIGKQRRMLFNQDISVDNGDVKALAREDFTASVLRPFLSQLSIHAYEGMYSLDTPDLEMFKQNLIADILDSSTIIE